MKTEFIQPRFTGPRFRESTLPVEVARDLAAYEVLIVELAKHLYLRDHADRQRVPKGFSTGFHLHIEKIDPGSARPMLALVTEDDQGQGLFEAAETVYFNRARELLAECIAANDALPVDFPKPLLAHFNQLGRSLREGEALELPRVDQPVAVLTPQRRKHLVLGADRVYEREVELLGSIGEADWEKSTFRLRLPDNTVCTVPMPESFHARAREFGGRPRHQVRVKGIATYDSLERLQKVIVVDSLEVQRNYVLAWRFDELAELEAGWHDGYGAAPDKDRLATVASLMTAHYPEDLPLPIMAPTQEGNLLLEWDAEGNPSVDFCLNDLSASYHAFGDGQQDIERDFLLGDEAAWMQFFAFLNEHLLVRTI